MTILNIFLHCLFIASNIKKILPVYQLLMESFHNLELDYVLPSNEDSDLVWYMTGSLTGSLLYVFCPDTLTMYILFTSYCTSPLIILNYMLTIKQ